MLLAARRAYGNLECSEIGAKKLAELVPAINAYFIVLFNLYAEMGKWDDAEKVRVRAFMKLMLIFLETNQ